MIGTVLVCGLLNDILILRLEHGPTKIAKLNPPQKFNV